METRLSCLCFKQKTQITWKHTENESPRSTYSNVPVGITEMLRKSQTAVAQSWEPAPVAVHDHFQISKANFKSLKFDINVSYLCKFILFEKKKIDDLWWKIKPPKINVWIKPQHVVSNFFLMKKYRHEHVASRHIFEISMANVWHKDQIKFYWWLDLKQVIIWHRIKQKRLQRTRSSHKS